MSMRSGLFDSTEVVDTVGGFPRGDKAETADFFAAYFACFVGNGVFISPSTNFQVIPQSGLTVRVRPGKCFINGYFGMDDSAEDKTFSADTAAHEYWLILRLDLAAGSISKVWVTDPAVGLLPVRGSVIYDLAIAKVMIGAGVTNITDAMVTDLRGNTVYCGYVKSLIDGIGANVSYADIAGSLSAAAFEELVPTAGGTMTGPLTLPGNPTSSLHAATKGYVDERAPQLTELVRYTSSGIFTPAGYPSSGNRYIVMLLGAGGGSYNSGGTNYSSGGAGAMQFATFIYNPSMTKTSFDVTVGAAAVNSDGGTTSFDCFRVPGGCKATDTGTPGVGGSTGTFTGQNGTSLQGGNSLYGSGATLSAVATGYGAGGFKSNKGTNGLVIVYGYR